MIWAFDTYYTGNQANTVCILFDAWNSTTYNKCYSSEYTINQPYISGQFYKRELPCILNLFSLINEERPELIIIDGFVYLNDDDKPGLGGHLYEELGGKIPVAGIAKSNFATVHANKRAVFRGNSKRPLFVSAEGVNLDQTARKVQGMSGNHRIPDLLKMLDELTRYVKK